MRAISTSVTKPRGRPQEKFKDDELEALLAEDNTQTKEELALTLNVDQATISRRLRKLGKIQKLGRWVPHELNARQKNVRFNVCQELLQKQERKGFLHRIVTSDEKWIFFENPKRNASWVSPGEPAAASARSNRYGKKTLLCVCGGINVA